MSKTRHQILRGAQTFVLWGQIANANSYLCSKIRGRINLIHLLWSCTWASSTCHFRLYSFWPKSWGVVRKPSRCV